MTKKSDLEISGGGAEINIPKNKTPDWSLRRSEKSHKIKEKREW